jgi:BioD-like phosphotransacetylase family protein
LVAGYSEPSDVADILAAIDNIGERSVGVIFNGVKNVAFDELQADVVAFLERRGINVLGVIPYTRELGGVTVETLAAELGAERLTAGATDGYLERFVVGAMSSEQALRAFRRTNNAAVITGGDRSEIQTLALEAPGVNCLVLTGGYRPSGTVLGLAEEKNVPVLLVGADTLSTIERAEDVVRSGRTRDRETVERMSALLDGHVDIEALLGTNV